MGVVVILHHMAPAHHDGRTAQGEGAAGARVGVGGHVTSCGLNSSCRTPQGGWWVPVDAQGCDDILRGLVQYLCRQLAPTGLVGL